jgi:beta-glucosidase
MPRCLGLLRTGAASIALACAMKSASGQPTADSQSPTAALASLPFHDPSLPIAVRVDDLVSRMTLEEKVPQMMHAAPAMPRLGIPAYNWWSEGLHGVAAAGIATVFPQAIGMAASFDPDLLHTEADVIATEFRAKYNEELRTKGHTGWFHGLTVWSPNINIFRDPRWGRGQETYGEDPFLASRMGVAFVTGLQGDDPTHLKALATPKHFAVHSGPESTRHTADVQISDHDLEDMYLPAFRATVLAGAGSVMCAYNSVDGKPACAQPLLLEEHLREHWDFGGYVVSDCGAASDISAHHHYAETMPEAMAAAVKSGMDIVCTWPEAAVQTESAAILAAVHSGLLSTDAIDRAVRRLFAARMKLGMFDPPKKDHYSTIPIAENDSTPHRELALHAARETMVLLKNQDRLLPLSGHYKTIAVIGPNADNVASLVGNYNGTPANPVTVLAGIRKRFPGANVLYAEGSSLIGPPLSPVPGLFLKSESGARGLSANYYRGRDLQGTPIVSRVDGDVNFVWQNGAGPGLPSDFSVRWTGALVPVSTGNYEVGFRGTDRFRMWLDGELIAETDYAGNGRTLTRTIRLEAGHSYLVRIEYAQEHESGRAQFVWHEAGAGKDYLGAVRQADLIIAVLGLTSELEGEEMPVDIPGFRGGDRTSLDLPNAQQRLLENLVATRKPVVLVLMNGSALSVNWADRHVGAILEAWYPGEEGGTAVAEVLAGDVSPSGKLPITFYKSIDQLPAFENYGVQGHTYRYFTGEPLYPFGYGLSYSTFAFTRLMIQKSTLGASDDLVATVDVTNTGKVAGDEVVEVYVSHPAIEGAPLRSLAGMQRVNLLPGETKPVSLRIANRDLSTVGPDGTRRIVPGELRLWIGDGQPGARSPPRSAAGIAGSVIMQGEAVLPK